MNAGAPAEVLIIQAFGLELVLIGAPFRVAVGDAVHDADPRNLRRDCPSDLDVVESTLAAKELNRSQWRIPSISIKTCRGPRNIAFGRYGGGSTTRRGFSTRRRNTSTAVLTSSRAS